MRELSTDMEQVSGGYMTLDGGLNMIGALAGAAVFLGAAVAGHVADTTEFAFAPIVACNSLSVCGLHASMEAFDSAGSAMRRRPLTLVIDEIVELLSSSLATAILDAGYFLRLDVAAALLTECSWVNELVRLQREEGCDLAVQISVDAASLDPCSTLESDGQSKR